MKTRFVLHAGLIGLALLVVGCGPNITADPAGPTGPTTLSPLLVPRLDGVWGGDLTLTGITGGTGPAFNAGDLSCVGAAFANVVGESSSHTLAFEQNGTDLSARLTSATTGLACTYTGRVGTNGTVVLDATACETSPLVIRCTSGVVRTLTLVSSSITATVDAPVSVTNLEGTAAHTYNVAGESGLVANHAFSNLTRR